LFLPTAGATNEFGHANYRVSDNSAYASYWSSSFLGVGLGNGYALTMDYSNAHFMGIRVVHDGMPVRCIRN